MEPVYRFAAKSLLPGELGLRNSPTGRTARRSSPTLLGMSEKKARTESMPTLSIFSQIPSRSLNPQDKFRTRVATAKYDHHHHCAKTPGPEMVVFDHVRKSGDIGNWAGRKLVCVYP